MPSAPLFLSPASALKSAVDLVGGQSAMARLLGLAQASVWAWVHKEKPLPAEHVLKVEEVTGISRHDLRPDLYPRDDASPVQSAGDRLDGVRG